MAPNQTYIWKKRILVPFWIVRIIVMLFIIAAYAWALKKIKDEGDHELPSMAVVVVFMLLIIIVLLIDILAIILFLRDALKPGTFLIMNSVQTGFWAGVLIMDVVAIARGANAVGIAFSVFVFLSFLGLLLYAIRGYRAQKKLAQRGQYELTANPAAPPAPGFHPPAFSNAAPYQQQNTSYAGAPQYPQHQAQATQYPAQYPAQYQTQGAASSYFQDQPVKPAHMV